MSVMFYGKGPGRTRLKLESHGTDDIDVVIIWDDRAVVARIATKDLVLGIKRLEEERDAEHGSYESYSKGLGPAEHEDSLTETLYRTKVEFGEMCRAHGSDPVFREAINEALRRLSEARTLKEVNDIRDRIKEIYLRTIIHTLRVK